MPKRSRRKPKNTASVIGAGALIGATGVGSGALPKRIKRQIIKDAGVKNPKSFKGTAKIGAHILTAPVKLAKELRTPSGKEFIKGVGRNLIRRKKRR